MCNRWCGPCKPCASGQSIKWSVLCLLCAFTVVFYLWHWLLQIRKSIHPIHIISIKLKKYRQQPGEPPGPSRAQLMLPTYRQKIEHSLPTLAHIADASQCLHLLRALGHLSTISYFMSLQRLKKKELQKAQKEPSSSMNLSCFKIHIHAFIGMWPVCDTF